MHPLPVDLPDVSMQYEELSEMQNDESVKIVLNVIGTMACFVMRQR